MHEAPNSFNDNLETFPHFWPLIISFMETPFPLAMISTEFHQKAMESLRIFFKIRFRLNIRSFSRQDVVYFFIEHRNITIDAWLKKVLRSKFYRKRLITYVVLLAAYFRYTEVLKVEEECCFITLLTEIFIEMAFVEQQNLGLDFEFMHKWIFDGCACHNHYPFVFRFRERLIAMEETFHHAEFVRRLSYKYGVCILPLDNPHSMIIFLSYYAYFVMSSWVMSTILGTNDDRLEAIGGIIESYGRILMSDDMNDIAEAYNAHEPMILNFFAPSIFGRNFRSEGFEALKTINCFKSLICEFLILMFFNLQINSLQSTPPILPSDSIGFFSRFLAYANGFCTCEHHAQCAGPLVFAMLFKIQNDLPAEFTKNLLIRYATAACKLKLVSLISTREFNLHNYELISDELNYELVCQMNTATIKALTRHAKKANDMEIYIRLRKYVMISVVYSSVTYSYIGIRLLTMLIPFMYLSIKNSQYVYGNVLLLLYAFTFAHIVGLQQLKRRPKLKAKV